MNGWPEKHRPRTLEDMALDPAVRERFTAYLNRGILPRHLILHGRPGFGKTTIAEIIKSHLYVAKARHVMDVDATKSGNATFIREHVTMFMRVLLGQRLVIFHEASGLSGEAAAALREPLERFADDTRVIFTTNHVNKIDEAIRDRCDVVEIGQPPFDEYARRLGRVLAAEAVQIEAGEIVAFTRDHSAGSSLRSFLGAAQNKFETRNALPAILTDLVMAIREVFSALQVEQLQASVLVPRLQDIEGGEWKDITARRLAKVLGPLGIGPKQLWFPGVGNKQGYRREWFKLP